MLFAALLTLGTVNAMAAMVSGKVEVGAVTGKVSASFGQGSEAVLAPGSVLSTGAVVSCGADSTAELYFANGAKVVVLPGAKLSISKFDIDQNGQVPASGFKGLTKEASHSSTHLYVARGRVLVEARDLNVPLSEFKVTTPLAVASVSGTVFYVEQSDVYVKIGCVEGGVSVQPRESVGTPVALGEKETVVYRLRKNGDNYEGYFEAVRPMTSEDFADTLAQVEKAGKPAGGLTVQGGDIEVNLDSEEVIDNSLILVSPNGDGQGG